MVNESNRPRRSALVAALGAGLVVAGCATSAVPPTSPPAPMRQAPPAWVGGGMPHSTVPGMPGGRPDADRDDAGGPQWGVPDCSGTRTGGATPQTGSVIIGEAMSAAQAQALQASVAAGHQPWRLDPSAVALTFARARLGWDRARVALSDPHTAEVTHRGDGSLVALQLRQPAREGADGIWMVSNGVWIR